jgi:type I restriction enzyme S subunit
MKGYNTYKNSDVEWIGEIPEHWTTTSVKNILEMPITDGPHTTPNFIDEGVPFISAESIKNGKINFQKLRGFISENDYLEFSKKYIPKVHDIFMVKSGATTGNIAMVEIDLKFTIWSPLAVFRANTNKMSPFFLRYFLESNCFKYSIELNWSYGTQQNIGMGVLSNLKLSFPSVEEQTKIASFLDYKTNLIDTTIEKKKRLIELLKEKRQAVINEAVTKGLNPNALMKDSGVEWLGEIPEHWKVVYLKHIGKAITGITYSPNDVTDEGTLVLRSSNIQKGNLSLKDCVFVNKTITEKYVTRFNDLLICSRNGSRNLIGKNILIDDNVKNQTWGAFMTIYRSRYNDFIYYFFNSDIFTALSSLFLSSTINQLTIGTINNFQIAFPNDENERKEIIKFLKSSNLRINKTIKKLEIVIEKLQTYRQSLISEAVTGKIDVRHWQPPKNK